MHPETHHVSKRHETDSAACWCRPKLYEPCRLCEPEYSDRTFLLRMPTDKGCRHCEHGLIRVTDPAVRTRGMALVVVHQ
jgi:hypothetical protein